MLLDVDIHGQFDLRSISEVKVVASVPAAASVGVCVPFSVEVVEVEVGRVDAV